LSADTTVTYHVATRVAKNTIAQVVAMTSTVVSKLLITILIARLFGPEQVGQFAFLMTFSMVFTFLSSAGVPLALFREVAVHRDQVDRYVGNGLALVGISGLITIPVMYGVATLMGQPSDIQLAVILAGVALGFDSMAQVLYGAFAGFEQMELGSLIIIAQEVTFLLVGIAILWLGLPFLWLFAVYIPSRLMGLIVGLVTYRRVFDRWVRFQFKWPFVSKLLRTSLPFAANMALGPVYVQIDIIMLSWYRSEVAIGLYSAATSIFYRFNVFARMINNALMPLMAREFEHDPDRARKYLSAAIKYQVAFGISLSVWCFGLANWLIDFLYGPKFEASAIIFRLVSTAIILRFLNNILATTLTALGLQPSRTRAVALAALFNITLNLYVLPRYGIWGAMVTSVLTEVVFFVALYHGLAQTITHPLASVCWPRLLAAGLTMATTFWLAQNLPVPIVLALSGTAYLVALLVLRVFSPAETYFVLRTCQIYRIMPVRLKRRILCDVGPIGGST
jgi:O-antigen/teichoic acid export membrane protein